MAVAALGAASGCSRLPDIDLRSIADAKIPGVYRLPVQQGNVLDAEALSKLEPGLTKRKVSFLIGTPAVQDVFHQDRWDYVYTYQPGGGRREERAISLFFVNDKLARIEGDVASERRAEPPRDRERVVAVPAQPHHRSLLSIINPWSSDRALAASPPPKGGESTGKPPPTAGEQTAKGSLASAAPTAASAPDRESASRGAADASTPAPGRGGPATKPAAAEAKGGAAVHKSLFDRLAERFSLPGTTGPDDGVSESIKDGR